MDFDYSDFADFSDYSNYGYNPSQAAAVTGLGTFNSFLGLCSAVLTIIALWMLFKKAGKPGWHAVVPFLNIYTLFEIAWNKGKGIATIVLSAIAFVAAFFGGLLFGIAAGGGLIGVLSGAINPSYMSVASGFGILLVVGFILIIGSSVCAIIAAVFNIIAIVKLGRSFGKSGGFLVGLVFVPVVFLCIMAFGKAEYLGPDIKPDNNLGYDPNANPYNNTYSTNNTYNNAPDLTAPNTYNQTSYNQTYSEPTTYEPPEATVSELDSVAETPAFCGSCGTKLTTDTKFCPNCGKPV